LGAFQGTRINRNSQDAKKTLTVEPTDKYVGRLLSFFDYLVASASEQQQQQEDGVRQILAVTHGGPVKTLVPALVSERNAVLSSSVSDIIKLNGSLESQHRAANCSITTVEVEVPSRKSVAALPAAAAANGSQTATPAEAVASSIVVTGYGQVDHLTRGDRTGVEETGDSDLS
jgi:hypothetical protein